MHSMKRWISLITAVLESLCFAGIIYGWGSFSYVLQQEGYFNSTCKNVSETKEWISRPIENYSRKNVTECKAQAEVLNLVFTIALCVPSFLLLGLGYILDKFGTWVIRSGGVVMYVAGWLAMAFTTWRNSWVVFLSMILIRIGGLTVLISNNQVANLFPQHRALVIAIINGAYDSSAVIFTFVKVAYDNGVNFYHIMYFLTACAVLMIARFLFLMPRMHIPYSVPHDFELGLDCSARQNQTTLVLDNVSESDPLVTDDEVKPTENNYKFFKSCLFCLSYILNMLNIGFLQLRNQFFYGTIKPWLVQVDHDNPNETSSYLNAFGIIQLCGILVSPLGGILTDLCIKKFSFNSSVELATRRAVAIFIGLGCVTNILFSITVLVPVLPLQYLTFFLQIASRSVVYGGNATFLFTIFPQKYFGRLFGITIMFATFCGLLQYPLFVAVTNIYGGDFTVTNTALLIVACFTLVHPLVLYMRPIAV
ncbi:equilibrative nucleobase transporter 1-like [Ciona intestinalis]